MITQVAINGVVDGSTLLLVALGFALIYSVFRFFNFAHILPFVLGAYASDVAAHRLGTFLFVAVPFASTLGGFVGVVLFCTLFRPLQLRRTSSFVLLFASLGTYIVGQNILSLAFGDYARSLDIGGNYVLKLFGAHVTQTAVISVLVALGAMAVLGITLRKTRLGKQVRAIAADSVLASVSGVNSKRLVPICFFVGSGLAAAGGALYAADHAVTPTAGMEIFVSAAIAAVLGGGDVLLVALSAYALSLGAHLTAWYCGSQWQQSFPVVVLLLFLCARQRRTRLIVETNRSTIL